MNKKLFFMPGEELTEEGKVAIRNLEQKQQQDREELLAKHGEKEAAVDFMNAAFEPFEDRVLVFPDPVADKTAGGLIVPDSVIEKVKPLKGTVVKVGPGKAGVDYKQAGKLNQLDLAGLPISPGDRIYYGNYAGTEIEINKIKYLIMRFADCFGRLKS